MSQPILLTGFGPFRHHSVNSSWEAVRLAAVHRPEIRAARLTVDHLAAAAEVRALIRETRPEVVLLVGLAAGAAFRLETLARPGVLGAAPAVRRCRWPITAARSALAARGIPVRLSRDAGAYVCDTTYWAALGEPWPDLCLFLHVPPLGSAWTIARIARGVDAVLGTGIGVRAARNSGALSAAG